jgi:hypothetical protein
MKFKTVMVLKAIICLGFGPVLLFFPGPLLKLLGATFCSGAAFTAREYGAALIGNLLLTWFARNAEPSNVRQAIALYLCVYDAIGFIVTLYFIQSGMLNALAWGIVAVYLFFAVTFALFISPKKRLT